MHLQKSSVLAPDWSVFHPDRKSQSDPTGPPKAQCQLSTLPDWKSRSDPTTPPKAQW